MTTSLTAIASALLVSADPAAIQDFSRALKEFCISSEVCNEPATALRLLGSKKFDAVLIDLKLGEDGGKILDSVRVSPSNQTAVTFAIGSEDASATTLYRKRAGFFFERPFSMQSIRNTLKPAYGLILRERRRYFRYPVAISVIILRQGAPDVRCRSVNISEAGMAGSTFVPLKTGEETRIQFTLPGSATAYIAESRVCWCKGGRVGVRFISLSAKGKVELHRWLWQKQEEMLPEFVIRNFQMADKSLMESPISTKLASNTSAQLKGNMKFQSGREQFRRLMRLH